MEMSEGNEIEWSGRKHIPSEKRRRWDNDDTSLPRIGEDNGERWWEGEKREREKKLIARGIIREDRRPSGRYSFPVIVVQPITHA